MAKKHKNDTVDTETNLQMEEEHSSKKKHKNKKIRKREERIEVKIETVNGRSDKSLPLVGYFPSGYDPEKRQRTEQPTVRVLKKVDRNTRLQLVVSPCQSSPVTFVGTNYSGEGAAPQMCSYSLGVFDKQTKTLKIVQIETKKIFRLEPTFGDHDNAAYATPLKVENEATVEDSKIAPDFSTKRLERMEKKDRTRKADRNPEFQEDLNTKMADAMVNKEAIVADAGTTISARNIPPHDMSATDPLKAYPLEKIILTVEWSYLYDIIELMQEGKDIKPEAYPLFVCNRVEKINDVEKEELKETLACIFSYINHLIKFKDLYTRQNKDAVAAAKRHKFPSILTQRFNNMFAITESKRLVDEKRDLLISYVLVLTLFVDNCKTEYSDIAKDLRMNAPALRPYFQLLGCKFVRENNKMKATLHAPLTFPVMSGIKRRKK